MSSVMLEAKDMLDINEKQVNQRSLEGHEILQCFCCTSPVKHHIQIHTVLK